jgi:hypothetical protein
MPSVLQEWVHNLPFMQQSVLITAVRGPDGVRKYAPPKMLLRWFRRCFLISALDNEVLVDPHDPRGGSFTGPGISKEELASFGTWELAMRPHVDAYMKELDAIPHHFQTHFMHATHIVGVYHPDTRIREFWKTVYIRLVNEMHLTPEPDEAMARRLGDNREDWLARSDPATTR